MIALIVTAQMISAILFDHFGLLGFPLHPVSLFRMLGAPMIIAGVYLILINTEGKDNRRKSPLKAQAC